MIHSEIHAVPRGTRRKAVAIAIASAVFASGSALADAPLSIVSGTSASVLPSSYGAIAVGPFAQVVDGTQGAEVQDDFRGATSVSIGTFNTIEVGSEGFDGVANTIVGQVNYTKNANGALIYGAGNSVTNSYAPVKIDGDIELDLSNPGELSGKLGKAVGESGGKVLAIGGANTADYATNSQLMGVGNTLKGKEGDTSDYNLVDGVGNTLTDVDHVTVIGSKNTLTTVENAIVLGDENNISKKNNIISIGSGNTVNGDSAVLVGEKATAGSKAVAIGNGATASMSGTEGQVAIGYGARASKTDSVALGAYSVAETEAVNTESVTINGTTYKFAGVAKDRESRLGVVSVGGKTSSYQASDKQGVNGVNTIYRQVQNVAAGRISESSTDAVNGSQLYATNQAIEAIQEKVDQAAANSTDTHVKAGSYAVSDAGQVELKLVDKNGNEIADQSVVITDVAKASDVGPVSSLNERLKNESGATTLVDAVNKLDDKVGDQKYSQVTGTAIADGDSVTDAIGKLNNRTAAAVTEAAKHTTLTEGENIRIEGTDVDGQKNYKVSLADDISVKTVTAESGTIGGVSIRDGAVQAESASIGSISISDGKVTAGTTVISSDAVAVGDSSLKTGSLTVNGKEYIGSDGISANGQKITNVAAGTADTDAVNYGQLQATQAQVDSNSSSISNLWKKAGDLNKKINRTGANAAALAALHPLDYDEDHKVSGSVGIGQYHGTGALAVGVFIRPTENLMFNLGGAFASNDRMFNAGVSYRFGDNGSGYGTKSGMAQQVSSLTAENKDLTGKLETANTRLESANAKIDKVTAENAELRAEIEKIKAALKLK